MMILLSPFLEQFFFYGCLYSFLGIMWFGGSGEWVRRFAVWSVLWMFLTPHDNSCVHDVLWQVAVFLATEWAYLKSLELQRYAP